MGLEQVDDHERRISEIDRRLQKLELRAESIDRVDSIDARLRQLEHDVKAIAPNTSQLIMTLQALCDRILITKRDVAVCFTLNGENRSIMWNIRGNHDFHGLLNRLVKTVIREKEEGIYNGEQGKSSEDQKGCGQKDQGGGDSRPA